MIEFKTYQIIMYCTALNLSFQLPLQSALSGHYDLTVSSNSTTAAVNIFQHDFQDMDRLENYTGYLLLQRMILALSASTVLGRS